MALEAGKHVNSEVPASHSIDDCWRIVLAQERTGKVYQLAEQTRYWGFVRGLAQAGRRGATGARHPLRGPVLPLLRRPALPRPKTRRFVHPSELGEYPDAVGTWMNEMPPIHYLPHELSPMLKVLDDRVTEVVGMSTRPQSYAHPQIQHGRHADGPDEDGEGRHPAHGRLLRSAAP